MTKTIQLSKEPQVIEKGKYYIFAKGGEEIFSLSKINHTYREKLKNGLSEMVYFLPLKNFVRSEVELPNEGKELEKYNLEREDLATWMPVIAYVNAEDKKRVATELCSELMHINPVPDVFVSKFSEILDEFSEILLKHINNANYN